MEKKYPKILLIMAREELTSEKNYLYAFTLGIAYISAVLKKAGYDVDCLNLNHFNETIESVISSAVKNKNYDFVGFGHTALSYLVAEKIISSVRKYIPNSKIIVGGPIVNTESELMINSLKPDFAVIGEGEETILELLKCLQKKGDLLKVDGIAYGDGSGKLIFTKKRKLIEKLDSIPYPDFDGFDFEEQLKNIPSNSSYTLFDHPRVYPLLASRGCPFSCSFCYHEGKYRMRSIAEVLKELNFAVKKYRINMVMIYDDCFAINRERLLEFCEGMKKLKSEISWDLKWAPQLTVHLVNDELLQLMKDSGCGAISYGFESMSPAVLKSMGKPITPQQIDNALKKTLEHRIAIQANFIFGDIAETKETARETLNYWKKHCRGQVALAIVDPYPGSRIYNYCIEKGIIRDKLFFIKNQMAHTFNSDFNMTSMSNRDFKKLKDEIVASRFKYYGIGKRPSIKGNQLKITCPFCKKRLEYKNVLFKSKLFYDLVFICKNCSMKFYAMSYLKQIGYWVYPLYKAYLRIKNSVKH